MVISRRNKVHRSMWQILWIALVFSICSAGISAAGWQDETQTTGTVVTGEIKPVFDEAEATLVDDTGFLCLVAPQIEVDDKTISLYVENAYPGCKVRLDYTVKNLGSVPVRYQLETAGYETDIAEVVNEFPETVLEGNGGSAKGLLTLTVGNAPEEGTYDLQMQLRFKQAIPY